MVQSLSNDCSRCKWETQTQIIEFMKSSRNQTLCYTEGVEKKNNSFLIIDTKKQRKNMSISLIAGKCHTVVHCKS